MAKVPITVMGYRCDRCEHEWIPVSAAKEPKVCPKCKSAYWDTPRKQATATTYEDFRRSVEQALRSAGRGLTWTEIRTTGKLPQKLPNNQWVRRLEGEIGLTRARENGVILWSLTGSR
jgi:protein-arginine kinase activator protein McsA